LAVDILSRVFKAGTILYLKKNLLHDKSHTLMQQEKVRIITEIVIWVKKVPLDCKSSPFIGTKDVVISLFGPKKKKDGSHDNR
jgi:hypothetical protein